MVRIDQFDIGIETTICDICGLSEMRFFGTKKIINWIVAFDRTETFEAYLCSPACAVAYFQKLEVVQTSDERE